MKTDVIILGAGGAGLMCAIHAGRRGRAALVLDHAKKPGGKILISGGGRCNFTNLGASPAQYVSSNPHFCKSALSRYPSASFIEMVRAHGIPYHEKKLGQLFCDHSARDIVDMLERECGAAGARLELGKEIGVISRREEAGSDGSHAGFRVETGGGAYECESLVVATGGLSIPKLGATGRGYEIARQFGLRVRETAPALDGFTLADDDPFRGLSGISIDCEIECNRITFRENLLFTHSGLSGPAALQASLHWRPGDELRINLRPGTVQDTLPWLLEKKRQGSRALVRNLLSEALPARFADLFCSRYLARELPLAQMPEKALAEFCRELHAWRVLPRGTVGYSKAEVTRGGVDTDELSSKTMEARKVPGLYFIGEVVDVTGWLGGYNFQWAWASAWAAAQAV